MRYVDNNNDGSSDDQRFSTSYVLMNEVYLWNDSYYRHGIAHEIGHLMGLLNYQWPLWQLHDELDHHPRPRGSPRRFPNAPCRTWVTLWGTTDGAMSPEEAFGGSPW